MPPSWEFWAAGVSLLSAAVMTLGPALARKIAPQDRTIEKLATSASDTVANALESTLSMVRGDMAHVRAKSDDNGKKLDKLLDSRKGKS